MRWGNILVATDGSHHSEAAVNYALGIKQDCAGRNVELNVLYVTPIDPAIGVIWEDVKDIITEDGKRILDSIKKKAEGMGVHVETILKKGIPSIEILNTAKEIHADIIIMGSHGHTSLGKVIMGSVAERVAGNSDIPVMVIK